MKNFFCILFFLLLTVSAFPQKRVSYAYDTDFEYLFDNRENYASDQIYSPSMTINAVRLTPSVGFDVRQAGNTGHRIMFGIDVRKNMGEHPVGTDGTGKERLDILDEVLMYYRLRHLSSKTFFTGYAGIFPRSMSEGDYSTAFISDSVRFYDSNIEGILLKFERPHSYYEAGLDWMGMIGHGRRERFKIFSYGRSAIASGITAGWTAELYHYANTLDYKGVVDNALLEPFVKFDFGKKAGLQELSLRVSWLQGVQQDRRLDEGLIFPGGGLIEAGIMNWNVGIRNRIYAGTSMMPYYSSVDDGGNIYGSGVYWGDPHYKIDLVTPGNRNEKGAYDRLEAFWQPHIADFVDFRLSVVLHFAGSFDDGFEGARRFGFAGWQQKLGVAFNLDRLLHPEKVSWGGKKNKLKKRKAYYL